MNGHNKLKHNLKDISGRCYECGKVYNQICNLLVHFKEHHICSKGKCSKCTPCERCEIKIETAKKLFKRPKRNTQIIMNDGTKCSCIDDCDNNCINYLSSIECDPEICVFNAECKNTAIQKNNVQSVERFQISNKGFGIRAVSPIAAGCFVMEYTGEIITQTELKKRMKTIYKNHTHHYALQLEGQRVIDAYVNGGECKFVNHSCDPNCMMQKWKVKGDVRIALFAIKDIKKNEELTFEYNFSSFGQSQICNCGAKNCRGIIGTKTKIQNNRLLRYI